MDLLDYSEHVVDVTVPNFWLGERERFLPFLRRLSCRCWLSPVMQIAGRRRTLLLNVKPARMSVKTYENTLKMNEVACTRQQ